MPAKKKRQRSPPAAAKAAAAMDVEAEYARLFAMFDAHLPSTKIVPSSVLGEEDAEVEIHLPSYFDYYPELKRKVQRSPRSDAVELMQRFTDFMQTGRKESLCGLMDEYGGETNDSSNPIVIDDDDGPVGEETAPDSDGLWQVHLGDAGWADFDDASNKLCEEAHRAKRQHVSFVGYMGFRYEVNFATSLQTNKESGTVRPIRRTSAGALYG